jgi:hypothetical protein
MTHTQVLIEPSQELLLLFCHNFQPRLIPPAQLGRPEVVADQNSQIYKLF